MAEINSLTGAAAPIPSNGGHQPAADQAAPEPPASAATTLLNVEAMASDAFTQIEAISSLSLLAMEAAQAWRSLETFAQAFVVIRSLAQEAQDAVSSSAEDVIKLHHDDAASRRYNARRQARELAAAGDAQ